MHSGPFAPTVTNNKISCSVFHYHDFPRVPQTSFFFARRSKHVAKITIFIKYLQLNKIYKNLLVYNYSNQNYLPPYVEFLPNFRGRGAYYRNTVYLNAMIVGISNNNFFISPTKTETMWSIKLASALSKLSKLATNLHLTSFGIRQIRRS